MLEEKINKKYESLVNQYLKNYFNLYDTIDILDTMKIIMHETNTRPDSALIKKLYMHSLIEPCQILDGFIKYLDEHFLINEAEAQNLYTSCLLRKGSVKDLKRIREVSGIDYVIDIEIINNALHKEIFSIKIDFENYKKDLENFIGIKLNFDNNFIQKLYQKELRSGSAWTLDNLHKAVENTGIKVKLSKKEKRRTWEYFLFKEENINHAESLFGKCPIDLVQKRYDQLFSKIDESIEHYEKEKCVQDYNNYYDGSDYIIPYEIIHIFKKIKSLEKELKIPILWDEEKQNKISRLVDKFVRYRVGKESLDSYNYIKEQSGFEADEDLKQEICLNILASADIPEYKKAVKEFQITPDKRMKKAYNLLLQIYKNISFENILAINKTIEKNPNKVKPDLDQKLLMEHYDRFFKEIEEHEGLGEEPLVRLIAYTGVIPKHEAIQNYYKITLERSQGLHWLINSMYRMYQVTKVKVDLPEDIMLKKYKAIASKKTEYYQIELERFMLLKEMSTIPPPDYLLEKALGI